MSFLDALGRWDAEKMTTGLDDEVRSFLDYKDRYSLIMLCMRLAGQQLRIIKEVERQRLEFEELKKGML